MHSFSVTVLIVMNVSSFLKAHPSVIGLTLGLFILAYIVVTILSKR